MSIRENEDAIFDELKAARNSEHIIRDGCADEAAYRRPRLKTVFVTKEYNGRIDYDLRDNEFRNPSGGGWWGSRIIPTLQGIHEISKDPSGPNICAFNLNKFGGGGAADMRELKQIALRDKIFLRRQYNLYDRPDEPLLTICCGLTWPHMLHIFREVFEHHGEIQSTSQGYKWYQRSKGKYVILVPHPAATRRRPYNTAAILCAIREMLGED